MNNQYFELYKKNIFEHHERFFIQIFLILISILGCDNNSRTVSKWPVFAAFINAVLFNKQFKFHERLII